MVNHNHRNPWLLQVAIGFMLVMYIWSSSGATTTEGLLVQTEIDPDGTIRRTDVVPKQGQQQQEEDTSGVTDLSAPQSGHLNPSPGTTSNENQPNARPFLEQELLGTPLRSPTECGLYLAPSTIQGAGMGMFTTKYLKKGDYVGLGEVVIPMVEIEFMHGYQPQFNPFADYQWRGREKGLHNLIPPERFQEVHAIVPGTDAAINCNLALINIEMSGEMYDDSQLHRSKDPMAGSMTPYHSTSSRVKRDIPVGGELFKFYGDSWFLGRPDFGLIPISPDYIDGQDMVDKFTRIRKAHFPDNEKLEAELWSLAKDTIGREMWESRLMNALPKTANEVRIVADAGDIGVLHQPSAIRDLSYLRQHGKCMDSIRPGPSTLPSGQAGKGGFATRAMPEGTMITGSPLLHIPHRDLLKMFRMEYKTTDEKGEDTWLRHVDDVIGHQMVMNYCYGHSESTLLLCPYAAGVAYINHNKTRANVKIQWSQHGKTSHNATWLHTRRVEELEWDNRVGLAFDYIATKDIEAGDELFLDYGDEFEEALYKHLSNWKAPQGLKSTDFVPAEVYNPLVVDTPIRTEAEQEDDPYPWNLEVHCHTDLTDKSKKQTEFGWVTSEEGLSCQILDRYTKEPGEPVYRVILKVPLDEVGNQKHKDTFTYFERKDVPRSAIRFFNIPYSSDLYLPNMFRKPIGIPDNMLPEHWKNLKVQPTSWSTV